MKIKMNRTKERWEEVVNALLQYCKGTMYCADEDEVSFYSEESLHIVLRSDGTWYTE